MSGTDHDATLNRMMWRSRIKALLRIGGILLMLVGGMFVPSCRPEPGPKTTIFDRIVNSGSFAETGVVLIAAGALSFAASWLVRETALD
jgi:hypothetical protein